ncbi:MAG: 50S ribosomal protein L31 [Candidatus Firestonebacteria bacterium]
MKDKIHPQYKETTITCTCGSVINTRSTKQNIKTEICSACHPFYTGQQKLVDTAGRVDKFKKRVAAKKPDTKKTVKKAEVIEEPKA